MSPKTTSACCKKGAHRIANVLYCFTCGATQPVGVGTPAEDPLLNERKKYDGMLNSMSDRVAS